jgi:plastocyanin
MNLSSKNLVIILLGILFLLLIGVFSYLFIPKQSFKMPSPSPIFPSPSPTGISQEQLELSKKLKEENFKKYQYVVNIKNGNFDPKIITIPKGEKLRFYTFDPVIYSILLTEPTQKFLTVALYDPKTGTNGVGEYIFEKEGTYKIFYKTSSGIASKEILTVVVK